MAYTNETTHYGIPLPLGSDLTTPMDYNTAAQAIDTNLFGAVTDSGSALQKANQLQQDLATTNDNVTAVAGRVTTLEGTSVTQGQAILQNTQDIADVRADALDMIVAKDEGTAQVATVAVSEGEYFRYNDVLYLATTNIAIGDTIVPNENCTATNVGTELSQLNNNTSNKVISVTGDGVKTYAQILTEIKTALGANTLNHNSRIEVTGTDYNSIFECVDSGIGIFNRVIGSGTNVTITTIRLDDTTWRNVILDTTPSITINDISSSAVGTSTTVKLYYV